MSDSKTKTPREVVAAAASAVCGGKPRVITAKERADINARCFKQGVGRRSIGEHLAMLGYTSPLPARQQPKIRTIIRRGFEAAQAIHEHEALRHHKDDLLKAIGAAADEVGVASLGWKLIAEIAREEGQQGWPNLGSAPRPVTPAQRMRRFAEVYNNIKMCPLIHDLIRVLFPGTKVKDPQRLMRRAVERYRTFRAGHSDEHLPELILRSGKDGSWIGVPPGVMEQLAKFRIDPKKVLRAKGLIVTSAQFGASLNTEFWKSLLLYAKDRGYEVVVLPIKYGPVMTVYQKETAERVLTSTFDEALQGHMLFEDLTVAGGMLRLNTLRLRPTLQRFLTDEICLRGGAASQIYAAPRIELEYRPRLGHDYPKAIMTTGAVTHPDYHVDNVGQLDRTGAIAKAEHAYAAVAVEFTGKKTFHFRQLLATTKGEFYDIDPIHGGAVYVTPKGITHAPDGVDSAYLGDWHVGKTHPIVRDVTFKEMLPVLRPKHILIGDGFDGDSISHWDENQASRRAHKAHKRFDAVETELDALVEEFEWMHAMMPEATLHSIASNHNEFLRQYLEGLDWTKDSINIRVCSELFAALQAELAERDPDKFEIAPMDPVNWWLNKHAPFVVAHSRRSDLLLPEDPSAKKILVTLHGDKGPKGEKAASMKSHLGWNQWVMIGHAHSAAILGPVWRVGTSTHLTDHYVSAPRTNWTHTHGLIFKNGQRMMLNIVNGAWHGQSRKRLKSAGIQPEGASSKTAKKKAARKGR